MAQFYPNGKVKLLSGIPWNASYRDTRFFSSLSEQTDYFMSKNVVYSAENCSYTHTVRGAVAVGENIEELWNVNYMMFQNQTMGDKWFYAFVDNMEMKAASTTIIYFHIDEIQTWMFEAHPMQAYIERRHYNSQRGDILPTEENIGTGWGYITTREQLVDYSAYSNMQTLITSAVSLTHSPGEFDDPTLTGAGGSIVHGLPSGCDYYIMGGGYATISECMEYIKDYPWVSKGIIAATIIPSEIADSLSVHSVSLLANGPTIGKVGVNYGSVGSHLVYSGNIFDGFPEVSDPKLLMYPFAYLELSCYNGETMIIKPQLTSGGLLNIQRTSALQPAPQIKYWASNYEGMGLGYDGALTVADFPVCPVQDVSYLATIDKQQRSAAIASAQLQFNTNNTMFSSVVGGISGLSTGILQGAGSALIGNPAGVVGGVSGAVGSVGNSALNYWSAYGNREFEQQKIDLELAYADTQAPTIVGNAGGTGFNWVSGQMGLHMRWRIIDQTHRDIISDYFKIRGYASKKVEPVDVNIMKRFTYIKTKDCHVSGSIPASSITIIQNIYDSGITFWKDDNIGDYSDNI